LFSAASTAIAIATTASMLSRDFALEMRHPRGVLRDGLPNVRVQVLVAKVT
jgi:hypothetical protein